MWEANGPLPHLPQKGQGFPTAPNAWINTPYTTGQQRLYSTSYPYYFLHCFGFFFFFFYSSRLLSPSVVPSPDLFRFLVPLRMSSAAWGEKQHSGTQWDTISTPRCGWGSQNDPLYPISPDSVPPLFSPVTHVCPCSDVWCFYATGFCATWLAKVMQATTMQWEICKTFGRTPGAYVYKRVFKLFPKSHLSHISASV